MKIFHLFTIFLLSTIFGYSQSGKELLPFIIQGKLTNCPEKLLVISFTDEFGMPSLDTLNLDEEGRFYLKTYKVTRPQVSSIQKNNIQINDFFVAPGYNLVISGNASDNLTLLKTKKIDGIGAEANRYKILLDSINASKAKIEVKPWFQLKESEFLSSRQQSQRLMDSIAHIVFDRKSVKEKYFKYFKRYVALDNKLKHLFFLADYVNSNNFNYENSVAFLEKNSDQKLLKNLYKDEYLLVDTYRSGFITNKWLTYIINLDYKADSSLKKIPGYALKKINETYTGKIREYVLYNSLINRISVSVSLEELNKVQVRYQPYMSLIENVKYKKLIAQHFNATQQYIIATQVGKAAPAFNLISDKGEAYKLSDFKGKVVCIDLWASWCSPCRDETPYMKNLYAKYKNDNRISILSIDVSDGEERWKKALDEDKPEWLQLIDSLDQVMISYAAYKIPRFIVIDKMGNIVDFDAPIPSDGNKLESLLLLEMEK